MCYGVGFVGTGGVPVLHHIVQCTRRMYMYHGVAQMFICIKSLLDYDSSPRPHRHSLAKSEQQSGRKTLNPYQSVANHIRPDHPTRHWAGAVVQR